MFPKVPVQLCTCDRNRNDTGVCHSCRYAIQAKEELFGDHLRTYIWQGSPNGGNQDINGDGVIANVGEEGEEGFIQEINLPGVPWCFEYGEEEWMGGVPFTDVTGLADDEDARGNPQEPQGRINCTTGAEL